MPRRLSSFKSRSYTDPNFYGGGETAYVADIPSGTATYEGLTTAHYIHAGENEPAYVPVWGDADITIEFYRIFGKPVADGWNARFHNFQSADGPFSPLRGGFLIECAGSSSISESGLSGTISACNHDAVGSRSVGSYGLLKDEETSGVKGSFTSSNGEDLGNFRYGYTFYGPNAEEVGGVYTIAGPYGPNPARFVLDGAFGAKRQ